MVTATKERPAKAKAKAKGAKPGEVDVAAANPDKPAAKAGKAKGKAPKAGAPEVKLKKKWEVKTGVPDQVVSAAYLDRYRKKPGALSVDELRGSAEAMAEFVKELPEEHHGVDPELLGKQLESLRKTGAIKLGTGRVGPGKGYKEKMLALLTNALAESGIKPEQQQFILDAVDQANKEGLTPSQVRILQSLVGEPEGLTRSEISKKAELSQSLTSTLGRSDGNTDGDNASLAGLGYVKAAVLEEGRRTVIRYSITAKGRKAIE